MQVLAPVNEDSDVPSRQAATDAAAAAVAGKVDGTGVGKIQAITRANYDALATKDASTLYVIVG